MKGAAHWLAGAIMVCAASSAGAVTPQQYRDVGVTLPAAAAVPPDATVLDETGRARRMAELITRPTVLVFADYTCTTLCGPIVAFVASALEQTRLDPGEQYRLLVVGLDPKDGAAEADQMRREHLGGDPALDRASAFVTADAANVQRLTAALGYRTAYDKEHDQFIHPAAAYVLTRSGKVSRVLTGLGLSGTDMRLALVEAGHGRIGTLGDQIRLLCSGFDPTRGTYNVAISRVLEGSAIATLLMLGGLICLLLLADRRRAV